MSHVDGGLKEPKYIGHFKVGSSSYFYSLGDIDTRAQPN